MTDDDNKPTASESVADFLRNNPDFFNDHPELLVQIKVPHPSGDAVSLVERQMSLLREQNERTRKKLDDLIEIARANEELARRMHMLALNLMDAPNPQEIFTTLYESLRQNFHADYVTTRIFAQPMYTDKPTGEEFVGADAATDELFKSILEGQEPVCGELQSEQRRYLFADDGDKILSGVLVPLHGDDWSGILAIGSYDAERFHPGMGVELLGNLGEILSIILKPWVVAR